MKFYILILPNILFHLHESKYIYIYIYYFFFLKKIKIIKKNILIFLGIIIKI